MGLGDIFGGSDDSDDPGEPTELQEQILRMNADNPDMSVSMIASRLDCSHSYASETLRTYSDWSDDEDEDESDGLGELFG